MKENKKTAYEYFMESINKYEIKEIQADDSDHFYVRCATKTGKTFLYQCIGDSIEEQLIPEDYEELIRSERFLLSMLRYLIKEDEVKDIIPIIRWHDYQKYHAKETEEPNKSFSLYDVWQLYLGEPPVSYNEYYEGKK